MKSVEVRNFGKQDTNLIQETVKKQNKYLNNFPILDGILIQNVEILATGTLLKHKLFRTPLGYIITRTNSVSTIAANGEWNENEIYLVSSGGTITCDIWVF